jgi:nitrate reductase gamma subunit
MILKIFSIAFVALFIARIVFARKLKEMGKAADRTLNLFLIAIAIYLGLQAIIVYAMP